MGRFWSRALIILFLSFLCASCVVRSTLQPMATPPPSPTPEPSPTATRRGPQIYQEPGDYIDSLTVDGYERLFLLHVPSDYRPQVPMPLVINLHGRGGTAFMQEDASRMSQKADEEGFLVVTPQALGEPETWYGVLQQEIGDQDRAFFQTLLAYLREELSIDPNRIYATGLSNGASMANWLGCDMAETLAAIAPVAGAHPAFWECKNSEPVSVLAIHGVKDAVIPYAGNGDDIPEVRTWVEAWVARNGCRDDSVADEPYPGATREVWNGCDAGVEVQFISVAEGEHTWLGLEFGSFEEGYAVKVGATDVIWDFFSAHPKISP